MIVFLSILFGIIVYIAIAGVTHGYGKYRWPEKLKNGYYGPEDDNLGKRVAATGLWPFYWIFIWPFTKTNEVTFSHIEKKAALQVAQNKARLADLHATRAQLEASNAELEAAEVEVEKEMAKL